MKNKIRYIINTLVGQLHAIKPGFHTCVSRTHNGAQCLSVYGHHCSQAIPAFASKACELATKLHMLNFCEEMRGLCRNVWWLRPIETNNARNKKDFLCSEKKSQAKNKKDGNNFRKVIIYKK